MPQGPYCAPCGKTVYPTPQAAWDQIGRMPKRRVNRDTLSVRLCPHGDGWHLHSDLRYGRRRKRRP